jgi:hypothetical protein
VISVGILTLELRAAAGIRASAIVPVSLAAGKSIPNASISVLV